MVAFDAPVGSEGTDYVESVVSGGVVRSGGPRTAVVLDLDPGAMAYFNLSPDGEAAARQARAAVNGGVGRELGGAEDHVIGHRAVTK